MSGNDQQELEQDEGTSSSVTRLDRIRSLSLLSILAAGFLALGIAALELPMGSISMPGAGLWPILTSVLGILMTAAATIEVLVGGKGVARNAFEGINWTRFGLFFVLTISFWIAYPFLGFLLSASTMMFGILKFVAGVGWKASVLTALISTGSLYLVFTQLLSIRL